MTQFCAGCGAGLPADARFCSACGKAVVEPASVSGSAASPRVLLMRPLAGRKLAGVCRGLASQYGWDVTLIRVIAVVLAVAAFPVGVVAYGVFWVLVPQESRPVTPTTHLNAIT
jgi:phage shock protein C